MRVAVIGTKTAVFHNFDRVLPRGTKRIITDGFGEVEKAAKKYAELNDLEYCTIAPNGRKGEHGSRNLLSIMERADVVVMILHKADIEPGDRIESVLIEKQFICCFVSDSGTYSILPYLLEK